ncbi:MAG: toll/interleukin-1 receptor domain-containing protein [Bacteroidales bacterium]|nr:toll/interleukin-1 receptor domain-containing protein [Bacteroidales bacterium]
MSYDVFISYRRKGSGAGVAGEMQSKLESRGYKVFLDVDNIGSGAFPDQIDNAIQQCNDFLLILSPGMLDRCVDEEDWVRHEIVLAERYGKNIVGVSLPGFVMPAPETLPEELREIPEKQVFLWSHEYRHASFEKIVENLLSTKLKKKRAKRNYSWIGIFVAVLALGGWWLLNMTDEKQPPVVVEEKKETNDYQSFTDAIKDTFAAYLKAGDSLLQLVPDNPAEKQDFELFMAGIAQFGDALTYERKYPGVIHSVAHVEKKRDSLMNLRQQRLKHELEAANKFLEVDQVDFARYRYENAQILALPEESGKLDAVGKKLSKK